MIDDPTMVIEMIGIAIALEVTTSTQKLQVLQQEGWLQARLLQEKEQQGHA
jgi:hypothetical protein